MSGDVYQLAVLITEFVDDYQPGIVSCEFTDAEDQKHVFIEKVPIVSLADLEANSVYPQQGFLRCVPLNRWIDTHGRELVEITTTNPDYIESTEGLAKFVVLKDQISEELP